MRTLLLLRHAERAPGGVHLSERGVRLAEELGRRPPRFDRVVTSTKPRALETAEAMGYRVDAQLVALGGLPDELARWVDRAEPRSFAEFVGFVGEVMEAALHARVLADLLRSELERLPDRGRLLVVAHGGVLELAAVGAVGAAAARWGPTLGYLEGVDLELGPGGWGHGAPARRPR